MLFHELLSKELDNKLSEFVSFGEERNRELSEYLEVLKALIQCSCSEVGEKIFENENVGAIPSDEMDGRGSFAIPFTETWENHEQARRWASDILTNRTTFAADASQILPGREISIPVAGIQVGWFENPHNTSQIYEKNAEFIVLTPQELLEDYDERTNPESRIGEIRFGAEVDRIKSFLEKKNGWQNRNERMPLAFFDNTFLVSFSLPKTRLQNSFIQKVLELIDLSRITKVPVIGYIDRSYSRDILNMLGAFNEASSFGRMLTDTSFLRPNGSNENQVLKNWGDRSVFCFSKRRGLSEFNDPETDKPLLGFTYLQTTSEEEPARIDVPSWIYGEGLLDEIIDVIRAECVIGLGYPYVIEVADQTAVITSKDQQIFFRALQEFTNRGKLSFSVSRKSTSKRRRR